MATRVGSSVEINIAGERSSVGGKAGGRALGQILNAAAVGVGMFEFLREVIADRQETM